VTSVTRCHWSAIRRSSIRTTSPTWTCVTCRSRAIPLSSPLGVRAVCPARRGYGSVTERLGGRPGALGVVVGLAGGARDRLAAPLAHRTALPRPGPPRLVGDLGPQRRTVPVNGQPTHSYLLLTSAFQ